MIDETADVQTTESSTVETPNTPAETSQTTSQSAPAGVKGFHEHPDWQRMVASRREDRGTIAALQRQIQELTQRMQPQNGSQPQLTQEEQQAVAVLKKLLASDPELAAVIGLAKQAPEIQQRFQGLDQYQAQAARAQTNAARSHIKELAEAEGLPTDDKSLRHIVRLVAGEAMQFENGNARYTSGDMGVLKEAFDSIKPWLQAMRKPAEQSVAQTKTKTKQLPPPMRGTGTQAGQPARPKPEPGKEREYEQNLHKDAAARIEALLKG